MEASRLGKGLRDAAAKSGAPHWTDFCQHAGISYHWFCRYARSPEEPMWMRNLRAVKRASGCSWDEMLGRW